MTRTRLRLGDAALAAMLGLAALALFSLDWRDGLYGGVAEVGAQRILAGDLPYRDFWTIYAPGQFYLLAGLFAVFGSEWLVSPIAASTLLAGACMALYAAARSAGAGRGPALAVGTAVALAVASTPFHRSCGSYPPTLLLLGAAWALMATGERRAPLQASLAAGLCLGTAALFKHDVAAYAALGLAVATVMRARSSGAPLGAALRTPLPLALAALAVFLPPMLVLGVLAGPDLWADLVAFPLGDFAAARPERFPLWPASLLDTSVPRRIAAVDLGRSLGFWIPWLAWIPAALAAWKRPTLRPWTLGLGVSFLLHMLAARVQINTHSISWTVYAGLALALAWRADAPRFVRSAAFALTLALLAGHAATPGVRHRFDQQPRVDHPLPAARGMRIHASDTAYLEALARWTRRTTPPGTAIFAGAQRHDILITSPIRLYFLLERLPAVRYQELHPAVADTTPVQLEMIRDLEEQQTPLVVLRSVFGDAHLDRWLETLRERVPAVGARQLDTYLACAYQEADRFGPYQILTRRPSSARRAGCPPATEP